jgi:ArsR family transcriptional regulator, arsenate/arsenite/antimonite-responsive transcriptional repressor
VTLTEIDGYGTIRSKVINVRSIRVQAHTSMTAAACCAPLGAPSLSDAEAEATARLFRALADPHRVKVINLLATSPDPVCVCEFTGPLRLSQPTVSHHLKKLVQAGLLHREQRGTWAYYSLNREALGRLAAVADLQGGTP